MAWASGMIGAPAAPWMTRKTTSDSSEVAKPQPSVAAPKIAMPQSMTARRPKRPVSQPVIGVTMAVATMLKVIAQAIWSWVAESEPCICGSTVETTSTVVP